MSDKVTYQDLLNLSRSLNNNRTIRQQHYIHFTHDGKTSEHSTLPAVTGMADHLYSVVSKQWWNVEIQPGTNEVLWHAINEEDVPKGLRLLLLLINS